MGCFGVLKHRRLDAQLPWMKEDEDVQQYLHSFEERMRTLEIPSMRWLSNLKSLLSGWAKGVIREMDKEDAQSYPKVKKALLKSYDNAQSSLATRALCPERKSGQSPGDFIAQVHRAWDYWTEELSGKEINTQGTIVVIEPTYATIPVPRLCPSQGPPDSTGIHPRCREVFPGPEELLG